MTLHPASHRLALLAEVDDLLIAIDALRVMRVLSAADVQRTSRGRGECDLIHEGVTLPGWDLSALFERPGAPPSKAWVLADFAGLTVALGVTRCLSVYGLPECRRLPASMFARRAGALVAAFAPDASLELGTAYTGLVLDLEGLLTQDERAALGRRGGQA